MTELVLKQRQRLIRDLAVLGIDAAALVAACDENLDLAAEYGCQTIETPNLPLGRKCSIGLRHAAQLADHVVWVGSDDWIHPDVFQPLLDRSAEATPAIFSGKRLAIVDLPTGRLTRIAYPSQYGAIPWIVDSRLLQPCRHEPIRPDLRRGLDGALIRGIRLTRVPFEIVLHDPHDFRCVDFKTHESITPYAGLAKTVGIAAEESPWAVLAEHYPADLVAQARDLSDATAKEHR